MQLPQAQVERNACSCYSLTCSCYSLAWLRGPRSLIGPGSLLPNKEAAAPWHRACQRQRWSKNLAGPPSKFELGQAGGCKHAELAYRNPGKVLVATSVLTQSAHTCCQAQLPTGGCQDMRARLVRAKGHQPPHLAQTSCACTRWARSSTRGWAFQTEGLRAGKGRERKPLFWMAVHARGGSFARNTPFWGATLGQ